MEVGPEVLGFHFFGPVEIFHGHGYFGDVAKHDLDDFDSLPVHLLKKLRKLFSRIGNFESVDDVGEVLHVNFLGGEQNLRLVKFQNSAEVKEGLARVVEVPQQHAEATEEEGTASFALLAMDDGDVFGVLFDPGDDGEANDEDLMERGVGVSVDAVFGDLLESFREREEEGLVC